MKSHIPIQARMNKKDFAALEAKTKEISREYLESQQQNATRNMLMLMAVCLNDQYGFGRDRLERLFININQLIKTYGEKDVEFWAHMEKRCEQLHIMQYLKAGITGY